MGWAREGTPSVFPSPPEVLHPAEKTAAGLGKKRRLFSHRREKDDRKAVPRDSESSWAIVGRQRVRDPLIGFPTNLRFWREPKQDSKCLNLETRSAFSRQCKH